MGPTVLDQERTSQKVRYVTKDRSPVDRLPVDDGEAATSAFLAEQHVVETEVAVNESPYDLGVGLSLKIRLKARKEFLANLTMLWLDPILVTFQILRPLLLDICLWQTRALTEPWCRGERDSANRSGLKSPQLCHSQPRLLQTRASDLIACDRGMHVSEQQTKRILLLAERG